MTTTELLSASCISTSSRNCCATISKASSGQALANRSSALNAAHVTNTERHNTHTYSSLYTLQPGFYITRHSPALPGAHVTRVVYSTVHRHTVLHMSMCVLAYNYTSTYMYRYFYIHTYSTIHCMYCTVVYVHPLQAHLEPVYGAAVDEGGELS